MAGPGSTPALEFSPNVRRRHVEWRFESSCPNSTARSRIILLFSTNSERRAADFQLRLADRITAFAGSMKFVYLHAIAFVVWMLVFEKSPWRR
jgi:uncharacterized membrane protein